MKKRLTITAIVFLATAIMSWADGFPLQFSSIDMGPKSDYAVDPYTDHYLAGLGGGVQLNFDTDLVKNLGVYTSLNYLYGISRSAWADSFQNLSLMVGISYTFLPDGQLSIRPEVGYGLCAHVVPGDVYHNDTEATLFFLDQMVTASVKILSVYDKTYSAYVSPELNMLIESGNIALLPGWDIGLRVHL